MYVAQSWERMNIRGHRGQGVGRGGGRGYGRGDGPCNVNEMNAKNSCGHYEVHKGGQIHTERDMVVIRVSTMAPDLAVVIITER